MLPIFFVAAKIVGTYLAAREVVDVVDKLREKRIIVPEFVNGKSKTRWMTEIYSSYLKNSPLCDITLPGTHDSATYSFGALVDYSVGGFILKCQSKDIETQLRDGIRYFDLRPSWSDGEFHIIHGIPEFPGPRVADVLEQIARYLQSVKDGQELVILNFSHFKGMEKPADHDRLIGIIKSALQPYLIAAEPSDAVTKIPLESLLALSTNKGHSTVLIVYEDLYKNATLTPKGFFQFHGGTTTAEREKPLSKYVSVFDSYANSAIVSTMKEDQLRKLRAEGRPNDALFLLSWTLTQNVDKPGEILATGINAKIEALAVKANRQLSETLYELYYDPASNQYRPGKEPRINIIYVDFYETSRAVEWSILLNCGDVPVKLE